MHLFRRIIFSAVLTTSAGFGWNSSARAADSWPVRFEFQGEGGYELLRSRQDFAREFDRFYLLPSAKMLVGAGEQWQLRAAVRLRSDTRFHQNEVASNAEVSARALNIQWNTDYGQATIGLQEVEWGEAFGLKVADVVHPYETTEYLLANTIDAKIPLSLANVLLLLGNLKLELIYSPFPRRASQPVTIHHIRTVVSADEDSFLDKPEYGGRLSYVFDSGLELKPFFYAHGNRLPLYQMTLTNLGPRLHSVLKRVKTVGVSSNYATDAMVLRGDLTYTLDQPAGIVFSGPIIQANRLQAVLGVDHTDTSGDTTIAAQVQTDMWSQAPAGQNKKSLSWVAVRWQSRFLKSRWEPQISYWHGMGQADAWLQMGATFNFWSAFAWNIGLDHVFKMQSEGSAIYFQKQSNVYTRLSYRF